MSRNPSEEGNDSDVTRLLRAVEAGADGSEAALLSAVYRDLRSIAQAAVRGERRSSTLQPTALVHEAWLRLQQTSSQYIDRRHYFSTAARVMRQLLIERYRRRQRLKRGSGVEPLDVLDELAIEEPSELAGIDLLSLDEALRALEQRDPRMAQIVQLRFFAGLSVEETAVVLEISPRTVKREWAVARAWLYQRMA
jgi:RNA polymerase sigma factor (TIGR02999 family)